MATSVVTKRATPAPESEMSEEDRRLLEELNSLMEKLVSADAKQHMGSLLTLKDLIRSATTSMTSVPSPLKYMRAHYPKLKEIYSKMPDGNTKKLCADVLSVIAVAAAEASQRECLQFCLQGTGKYIDSWGHEYVRRLEGELVDEWIQAPLEKDVDLRQKLLPVITAILQFNMQHNAEIQACDLLMEVDLLHLLNDYMDHTNFQRVCLYLLNCAMYVEEPENLNIFEGVYKYYMHFQEYCRALCIALQLNNKIFISDVFKNCKDLLTRKQLGYMLGRHQVLIEIDDDCSDADDLKQIIFNSQVSTHFHNLARELDIIEPKSPEEIYKSWLETGLLRSQLSDPPVDSARHNLASSFVNGFVNAGFSSDKLITGEDGKNWIYRNKEQAMMSATASLGLIYLWDVDGGLAPIDLYLYTSDNYIKAGALLALGIVNCGVKNECEPAKALLVDYLLNKSNTLRIGSVLGLGLAYAGTNREDILHLILPVLTDDESNSETKMIASVACSLVSVGFCNGSVVTPILDILLEMTEEELSHPYSRFLALAIGLCFLGARDQIETTCGALDVLPKSFRFMAQTMLEMCAYAGTSDVLIVQEMLHTCCEQNEVDESEISPSAQKPQKQRDSRPRGSKDRKDSDNEKIKAGDNDLSADQAIATIAVALVSMGEELSTEMSPRIFGQMVRYGEPGIRKAVPLAIALSFASNPQLSVLDILNKFSHDADAEVAQNAIFALGIVGAGTNNARLATMLRQLAQFHAKNPNQLFMVRLAQGLAHMGKGTLSLSPFHTERQVMNHVAVAGLLITLVSCLDAKNIILGKCHYLLYCLVAAIQPRWLVTLGENLEPLPVSVRVGQAVDVVAKAGKPKTIAGIRTQTTPILLAIGERAELATEDYISLTPFMEGFVILSPKEQSD